MKLTTILLAVLVAVAAFGAPVRKEYGGRTTLATQAVIGSEHAPLIYSSSGNIARTHSYTTDWMQIGFTSNVSDTGNKRIVEHNPEYFTLFVTLSRAYSGTYRATDDTIIVKTARFEIADSSDATVGFWNPDSSNLFIADGNYNRADYGAWTFEDYQTDTSTTANRRFAFPLKVLAGSHIRFVFGAANVQDSTLVTWQLKAEN